MADITNVAAANTGDGATAADSVNISSGLTATSDGAPRQSREPLTPTGMQSLRTLQRRRALLITLTVTSFVAFAYGVGAVLSGGGWTAIDIGLYFCILVSAPWTLLGCWNAGIGLVLLRFVKRPLHAVAPFAEETAEQAKRPIAGRTAVLMALRNEDAQRAFQRIVAVRESLDATGQGDRYDFFILSDSNDPEVIATEEALFAANQAPLSGAGRVFYRRRTDNTGFKAGNVRDFLERWGDDYDLMLPLDADSAMSGELIVKMTRIMERHPKLGILQSLAVGAPALSPFARLFQFGMRHGMRSFTMGSAWWQGDCGPFWGHNALVRIAPFKEHCELPVLPGEPPLGGHILSHDQYEAVLMRRAGYEVRVLPIEGGSWEENPVTLLDFMKREQRWCNGNMQYIPLFGTPNLRPTSRYQLVQAVLMYAAAPAWMGMTALAGFKAFEADAGAFDRTLAIILFFTMFFASLAPKLAGVVDVFLEPGGVKRYGGFWRFSLSVLVEVLFGILMAPAVALRLTLFILGLPFGRKIGWSGQVRDAYGLTWSTALKGLWAPTLFGLTMSVTILYAAPHALGWAAPVLLGLVFAAPFAVLTAGPRLGLWLSRIGLARIPEETAPAPVLERIETVQLAQN
ncbi:MAG: glucans biosynthesis glucosyltransferase MdoH [Neomegalonema sp.]|nr:glucans biosynthesis glucosyltransferase MdoH [Neomegalonema sp.]